jgi:quinol monooxygenase YgiN
VPAPFGAVDCENPVRLFFYEQWRDMAALKMHFAHPGSHAFMQAVREHAAASENITMYEATVVGA